MAVEDTGLVAEPLAYEAQQEVGSGGCPLLSSDMQRLWTIYVNATR